MNNKKPNINPTDDYFGTVLNCAIRYSLGRQTYMPHLVMDFARPLLPYLSDKTLWCMSRDIKEAETYGGYGSPVIDESKWKAFLRDVDAEIDRRSMASDIVIDDPKAVERFVEILEEGESKNGKENI